MALTAALRRIYYGWWVAASLTVVLVFSHGTTYYLISVMLPHLIDEFGWSRTAVSGLASLFLITLALLSPPVGHLCDRWGARKIMLVSAPFMAIALLMLSTIQSLWQLYATYFLLSLAATGMHTVPVGTTITRWFVTHRGTAMGLAMSGMSLGGFLVAPIAGFLNDSVGWRITYGIIGVAAALVLVPLILLVVKSGPAPAHPSSLEETTRSPVELSPARNLLRHPAFWLVTISFALISTSFVGTLTHFVAFLKDSGMSSVTASGMLGIVAGMGAIGKVLSGYLSDRISRLWVAGATAVFQALGLLVVMASQAPLALWVFAVLFGVALGFAPVVRPLVLGDFFGSAAFGTNYGWMIMVTFLGSAVGPPFAGYIYDTTGSYTVAFTVFIAAYAASVACLLLGRRLRPT
ncbi:MAG: MFS transporter [Dehalococcoidia bacterium]|jgi:predicted MFS family arabinose efflux permease|nr:MFS transporter [Dehalococcoidia bacterium]MDP6782872.1 MFS transporter [Dehalococcoidia bacterium]